MRQTGRRAALATLTLALLAGTAAGFAASSSAATGFAPAFTVAPLSPTAGAAAMVDDRSSTIPAGSTIKYTSLVFGDGTPNPSSSVLKTFQHTWATAGIYTMFLTIALTDGQKATASQKITVAADPSAPSSPSPVTSPSSTASPSASGSPTATASASPGPSASPSPSASPNPSMSPSASPSPSLSPSASSSPAPPPPSPSGFPDASTTGPTGALTVYNGNIKITQPGTYSNLDVVGNIVVTSPGVTLSNIKVEPVGGDFAIRNMSGSHLTITDCDLGPATPPSSGAGIQAAVVFADYTLVRCNVHGTADGLKANGSVTIQDSWIHNLYCDGTTNHTDGVQMSSGSAVVLSHNTIDNQCYDSTGAQHIGVSDVFVKTDQGAIDSVSVDNCLLLGYTGYATYDRSGSYGLPTNVAFTNNVFGLRVGQAPAGEGWSTGRLSSTNPGPTWTGNTDVNGVPV